MCSYVVLDLVVQYRANWL